MTNKTCDYKTFTEGDWKLFRKKIAIWQENYMDKLNESYMDILTKDRNPSENFWELHKRINHDTRKPGVMLEMKRSTMILNIFELLNDGIIKLEDLANFSDTLKETIEMMMSSRDRYINS